MGRGTSIIFGILLVLVAIDTMITHIIPLTFLPFAVIVLGVLVLMTPLVSPNLVQGREVLSPRAPFQFIRRWIFGLVIVVMGLVPLISALETQLPYLSVDSTLGDFILLGIGAVYLLASFAKTRNVEIATI